MEERSELNESLRAINTSLERLGFNGAVVRDSGAVEGLTVAVNRAGSKISDAIRDLSRAIRESKDCDG